MRAESILGDDCHVMSQNAMRNGRGEGISGWHVDDGVDYPCPEEIPRHDLRIEVPCNVLNALFPLTDIQSNENGPTQIVPGSHFPDATRQLRTIPSSKIADHTRFSPKPEMPTSFTTRYGITAL